MHRVQPASEVPALPRPRSATRLRCRGDRASCPHLRGRRRAAEAAPWARHGQGPVLRALDADGPRARPRAAPVGELTKKRSRAGHGVAPGDGGQAGQPGGVLCRRRAGAGSPGRFAQRIELIRSAGRSGHGSVVGDCSRRGARHGGQRRRLGALGRGASLRARVDTASATVLVGPEERSAHRRVELTQRTWVAGPLPVGAVVLAQASAHGHPRSVSLTETGVRYLDGPGGVSPPARRLRSIWATKSWVRASPPEARAARRLPPGREREGPRGETAGADGLSALDERITEPPSSAKTLSRSVRVVVPSLRRGWAGSGRWILDCNYHSPHRNRLGGYGTWSATPLLIRRPCPGWWGRSRYQLRQCTTNSDGSICLRRSRGDDPSR